MAVPLPPHAAGTAARQRLLTSGLVLMVTMIAFEAMAIATALPAAERDLGDVSLYGWTFSAFLLADVAGAAMLGQIVDRIGLALPTVVGLSLFAAGLGLGAIAPTMGFLVLARALQGLGAGAVNVAVYIAVARAYPQDQRPILMAWLSTAWVAPSLAGPLVAGFLAERASWRLVFGAVIPFVVAAGVITLPSLLRIDRQSSPASLPSEDDPPPLAAGSPSSEGSLLVEAGSPSSEGSLLVEAGSPSSAADAQREDFGRHVLRTLVLVSGLAVLLGGIAVQKAAIASVLAVIGCVAAAAGMIAMVRSGDTFDGRRTLDLARVTALKGFLLFTFVGVESLLPLTLVKLRHETVLHAGFVLTASCLAWTASSWIQARAVKRVGRRALVVSGLVLIGLGDACVLALADAAVPNWVALAGWILCGLGIGLAYPVASLAALDVAQSPATTSDATSRDEGQGISAFQTAETVGAALATGLAAAALAWSVGRHHGMMPGIAATDVVGVLGVVGAIAVSLRLPVTGASRRASSESSAASGAG